jgi:hypothetical protein
MPHFYGTTHSRERRDSRYLRTVIRAEPSHEEIAVKAYYCWQQRGCPHGSPLDDWLRAERELRERPGYQLYQ